MSEPVVSFYENDSTPGAGTVINDNNPLAFGLVSRGTVGTPSDASQSPIHIWNNKGGGIVPTMESVSIGFTDASGGNVGQFISGTAMNGNVPFYEARSAGASGCSDDAQSDCQPIGGAEFRSIGDIPANARRSIYLQCNVPPDAVPEAMNGRLVIDYTFEP